MTRLCVKEMSVTELWCVEELCVTMLRADMAFGRAWRKMTWMQRHELHSQPKNEMQLMTHRNIHTRHLTKLLI